MSKDRLLSDEELVNGFMYELPPIKATEIGWEKIGEQEKDLRDKIINFINTQKRLYAESVIGEDENDSINHLGLGTAAIEEEEARNQLRAEQRARIE